MISGERLVLFYIYHHMSNGLRSRFAGGGSGRSPLFVAKHTPEPDYGSADVMMEYLTWYNHYITHKRPSTKASLTVTPMIPDAGEFTRAMDRIAEWDLFR